METRVIVIKDPVKDCMYCRLENKDNNGPLVCALTKENKPCNILNENCTFHKLADPKTECALCNTSSSDGTKVLMCHNAQVGKTYPVPCNDKNCPLKKLSFYRRTKKYEKVIPLEKCPICGKRPVKYLTVTYNQSKKKNVDTYIYECYGKKLNAEEPHFEGEDKVTDRTARLAWNRLVKSYISSHKKHKN
jgi:hypothetical protein